MNKGLRDVPRSRVTTQEYRDNFDKIFRNNKDNMRDDKNDDKAKQARHLHKT